MLESEDREAEAEAKMEVFSNSHVNQESCTRKDQDFDGNNDPLFHSIQAGRKLFQTKKEF